MTGTAKKTDAKEEGPRSFAVFLKGLGDGDAEIECSDQLHELGKLLLAESFARGRSVSGELSIRIAFRAEPNGMVSTAYEVKRKDPKRRTTPGVMWLTEGGNFAAENPRQTVIPGVRVVKDAAREAGVREADDGAEAPAREA